MERETVRQILQIPFIPFVDFAIMMANLTPDERMAVELREHRKLCIPEAAEAAHLSETQHKEHYRHGMNKLAACWDGQPWIRAVLNEYLKEQH